MKKLFSGLLVFVLTFSALSAFSAEPADRAKEVFRDKAIELVFKNIDSMQLAGDVKPGEKLAPIFDDIVDFYSEILDKMMSWGDDDEDSNDNKLESAIPHCFISEQSKNLGHCEIKLKYKTGENLEMNFNVNVANDLPVSVVQNTVTLIRK